MAERAPTSQGIWQYRMVMQYPSGERDTGWTADKAMTVARAANHMQDAPEVLVRVERRRVTFGEPEVLDVV